MGNFEDLNVIGRRKYAELREYAKKPYLMKIQALSKAGSQILLETFTQKSQKSFPKLCMDISVENWYTLVQEHKKKRSLHQFMRPCPLPLHN